MRRLRGAFTRRVARAVVDLLTTARVVALFIFVELLIRWVRLPLLARLLGVRLDFGPAPANAEQLRRAELPPPDRRRLRCAARVAAAWPFGEGPCLRRSLVIGHVLRHAGSAVRLGIAADGNGIQAHAWVEVRDCPLEDVSGYELLRSAGTGHR